MSGKRNRTLKGEAAGGAEAEGESPCSDRVPAHGRHFGEPACGLKLKGTYWVCEMPVQERVRGREIPAAPRGAAGVDLSLGSKCDGVIVCR